MFNPKFRKETRTTIEKFQSPAIRMDDSIQASYYESVKVYRIALDENGDDVPGSEELEWKQDPLIKWDLTKQQLIEQFEAELLQATPQRAADLNAMINTLENEV